MSGVWRRPVARVYSYNLDRGGNAVCCESDLRRDHPEPQRSTDFNNQQIRSGDYNGLMGREHRDQQLGYTDLTGLRDRHRADRHSQRERRACTEFPQARSTSYKNYNSSNKTSETAELIDRSSLQADISLNSHRQTMFDLDNRPYIAKSNTVRENDDVSKRMADIRMTPYRGEELQQEYQASQQSRARLTSLNRELESITRNNMAYRSNYGKTARQLAKEAMDDEKMSSSYKKTRKIAIQSSA